jgi:hypothetical protein
MAPMAAIGAKAAMAGMAALAAITAIALAALAAAGCQKNVPAVARLDVQPRTVTLPYPDLTTVHFAWAPARPLDTEAPPLVFVHLLDRRLRVVRTFDHPFPQAWQEGVPVAYDVKLFQSAVAPPLAAGKYQLSVGLYDAKGKRWPLDGLGKDIRKLEYAAATVDVPAQPAGPRFGFSPAWLPVEPGTDRQVVARRWLSERRGAIQLDEVPGPGTVWLLLRIPPGDRANERLVPHEGAGSSPAVVVKGTCGGAETGISGPGPHEVEIPVEPSEGAGKEGGCSILMAPNFHLVSSVEPLLRSVSLENAAWIPGASRPAAPAAPAAGNAATGTPAGKPAATRPPAPPG